MSNTPRTLTRAAPTPFEVYVKLTDLKLLLRLMAIKGVSYRDMAAAAGYKSHAYMGRLLRGERTTLEPEAAVRVAAYLEVPLDSLFTVKTSTNAGSTPQRNRKAS